MRPIQRFKPGDPMRAARFDELRRALAPGGLAVGSGLERLGPGGGIPRLGRRSEITGLLSGTGPAYTFAQSIETAPGTWSAGPVSGTAYEVNGVTGLDAKRARLVPDPFGAWRFQHVAQGSSGPPPGGCGCFAEEDIPPTLYWTYVARRYDYFAGGIVTLGTTSGTLTYTDEITYGSCSLGRPGWVGEFEYWTEGVPPDTGFSALKITHCSTLATGGVSGPNICTWLALPCEPPPDIDPDIGDGALLFLQTGPSGCVIGSPCAGFLDGHGTPGFVYPDGTFATGCQLYLDYLCEHGAGELDYSLGIAGGVSIAHSTFILSL